MRVPWVGPVTYPGQRGGAGLWVDDAWGPPHLLSPPTPPSSSPRVCSSSPRQNAGQGRCRRQAWWLRPSPAKGRPPASAGRPTASIQRGNKGRGEAGWRRRVAAAEGRGGGQPWEPRPHALRRRMNGLGRLYGARRSLWWWWNGGRGLGPTKFWWRRLAAVAALEGEESSWSFGSCLGRELGVGWSG